MSVSVTYVDYEPHRQDRPQSVPETFTAPTTASHPVHHQPRSSFAQSAYEHADADLPLHTPPSLSRSSTSSSEPSGTEDERLAHELQQQEVAHSSLSREELVRVGAVPGEEPPDQHHMVADPHLARAFERRLSEVTYGRHTPRVNSVDFHATFASPEESMTDRQLLQHRLEMYGLCERRVKGDGACQFRALSDQLYNTPHSHAHVRHLVVDRLRRHPQQYSAYIPGDFADYCHSMEQQGTWGDHVTLQALSDALQIRIAVLTSFPTSDFIEILPADGVKVQRSLYISFWAEVHYNSVYPAEAVPAKVPKSKTFGSRKLHRLFHRSPQAAS